MPRLTAVKPSACPVDTCEEVKKHVDCVLIRSGGQGVVREVIEFIVKAKVKRKKSFDSNRCIST
jgi:3-deoxy-D-manno-octulosonate 8-phosphate phosphatase KdsC-like HAD superfamily phosphatase